MGIGLERFRSAAMADMKRLKLQTDINNRATGKLLGKNKLSAIHTIRAWVRKDGAYDTQHAIENRAIRNAFKDSLVKAFGRDIANKVLTAHSGPANAFSTSTKRLGSSTVRKLIKESTAELAAVHKENLRLARYNATDQRGQPNVLARLFPANKAGTPVPQHWKDDPELKSLFMEMVKSHPQVDKRQLTQNEIDTIARDATNKFIGDKEQRFAEAYPGLNSLYSPPHAIANLPIKDSSEVLANLSLRIRSGGSLNNEIGRNKEILQSALAAVATTPAKLAKTEFNIGRARSHRTELDRHFQTLQAIETDLRTNMNPASNECGSVTAALLHDVQSQQQQLAAKMQYYDEYLDKDPLSEKSAKYFELCQVHAGCQVIDDFLRSDDINPRTDPEIVSILTTETYTMSSAAQRAWQQAPANRRIDIDNPPFADAKRRAKDATKNAFRRAAARATRDGNTQLAAKLTNLAERGVDSKFKSAYTKALNHIQQWAPIERNMVVSRKGVTKTYKSEIIPVSQTNSKIASDMQQARLRGVSAGTKDDVNNARNLQVSRLKDSNDQILHQSVRHGVLDPWKAGSDNERRNASVRQADQVLHLAVEETAPNFKQKLLDEAASPPLYATQFKHTHVNFNLITPSSDWMRPFMTNYKEHSFTKNQFQGFEAQNGTKQYSLKDNNGQQVQSPDVEVDTITFSFGVNDLAQKMSPFRASAWNNVYKHDKHNMEKLVGDLQQGTKVGGYVGSIMDKLSRDGSQESLEIKAKLQRQVDIVRGLITTDAYKTGGEDPYKMARHTMRVVDLTNMALRHLDIDDTNALTQSQGCKSNKDRGGNQDSEIKAQAMIEDMGGTVKPDSDFEPEDQIIYDIAVTASGQHQNQRYNTGLPGSKNAGEMAARIANPDAVEYAKGFSSYTKA